MEKPIPYKKLLILAGLVVVLIVGGLAAMKVFRGKDAPTLPLSPKKDTLAIFLPAEGGGLMRKDVDAKTGMSSSEKVDAIMRELRIGNAVPDALSLHEFSQDGDGVLYLNFSHDLKIEKLDAEDEINTVYSLVNSFLANFRDARKVQILVEGQALHTIAGVVYTYAPIEFNNQLLEE